MNVMQRHTCKPSTHTYDKNGEKKGEEDTNGSRRTVNELDLEDMFPSMALVSALFKVVAHAGFLAGSPTAY